jgi:glucan 1,3-beta-glucosidase
MSCFLDPHIAWLMYTSRPAGYDGQAVLNAVHQYYLSSYEIIRASSANTLQLIHDAFEPLGSWNGWERPPQYQGVALDTHVYQMSSDAVSP